jgi:hypothetical protein
LEIAPFSGFGKVKGKKSLICFVALTGVTQGIG